MKSIRVNGLPDAVTDLYRDLRDRRLLIPAIALLVAIAAVPFVLSSSPEPAPPLAPLVESKAATAVEPAVLAEQSGLRSYRERLAALKQKNPFEAKVAPPKPPEIDEPDAPTTGGPATTTPSPSAIDSSAPVSDPVSLPPADLGGAVTDASSQPPAEPEQPDPITRFYAGRVEVKLGPHGETRTIEDVRGLELLPGEKNPVVAFLGLGEGGDSAIFSLSDEVVSTSGDGNCSPKRPRPCRFLRLKVGDERELRYGSQEKAIRLKLVDIEIVHVPDPRREPARDGNSADE